jgi:RNA polymerase sigma-70 factor (ECF subfamily)
MEELVHLAKRGDQAALEKLLVSIAPSIQRFGMRMCKDGADTEDVLQDTLMTILQHLHEFEGRSSFTSWAFALTRSACTRRRRGLKNKAGVELDESLGLIGEQPSPEQGVVRRQLSDRLTEALDELSDEYREVILLRDVESLTAPEAAETLGISVDAVKSRLHRARQALREALRPVLEPKLALSPSSCPDIMLLWARKLEGELDAVDCAEMEKHIAHCPACASACASLKTALVACRRDAAGDVPVAIQEQVRAAVRKWLTQSCEV